MKRDGAAPAEVTSEVQTLTLLKEELKKAAEAAEVRAAGGGTAKRRGVLVEHSRECGPACSWVASARRCRVRSHARRFPSRGCMLFRTSAALKTMSVGGGWLWRGG